MNQEKKIENSSDEIPKFSVTKKSLLKSIPYVVLYKNALNVKKLN
jgi:hypothetical protein